MNFNPMNSLKARQVLNFLAQARDQDLIYNLLLILCTNDIKF